MDTKSQYFPPGGDSQAVNPNGEASRKRYYQETTSGVKVESLNQNEKKPALPMGNLSAPSKDGVSETVQYHTDSKFSELLSKTQYEPLRDQLANLAAAKASGNFAFQVAASVDSLIKCSESVTEQALSEYKERSQALAGEVSSTFDKLSVKLEERKASHKKRIDAKLVQLSNVLDDIQTDQKELAKYRQLLTSLSANVNSE